MAENTIGFSLPHSLHPAGSSDCFQSIAFFPLRFCCCYDRSLKMELLRIVTYAKLSSNFAAVK